jgi:putative SOS response-associated peptidase YedK
LEVRPSLSNSLGPMCGRARLATDYSEIKIQLGLQDFEPPNLRPSWNVAPTQDVLVVTLHPETGVRVSQKMRWGLIPSWSKEPKMKYPTFNAKAETVATLASFRGAWKAGRRCLVVMDGFYEWRKGDKQPFAIARVKNKLTVMAGLWEIWRAPSGETKASEDDLKSLLVPYPSEDMVLWPVSKRVGNVKNDDPNLAAEVTIDQPR